MRKLIALGVIVSLVSLLSIYAGTHRFVVDSESFQSVQSQPETTTYSRDQIEFLQQRLTQEIEDRKVLQRRVERLEHLLSMQGKHLPPSPDYAAENFDIFHDDKAEPTSLKDALAQTGLDREMIDAILQVYSNNRMSLLELRNQAVREGWVNSDRYAVEISHFLSPGRDIQQQYGDEVYDRFLYAYGNPNRVRVTEVYAGSAAELAGIEIDDIILSYAAINIYTMADLRSATAQGEAGESVLVVVQRSHQVHYFNVPRGPLGIGMGTFRQLPQSPRE